MRISDWSSDVCSSDLPTDNHMHKLGDGRIEIVSANKELASADLGKTPKAFTSLKGANAPALKFPTGTIRWTTPWEDIAKEHGSTNDLDAIGSRFRQAVGSEIETLQGERLVMRFMKFFQALPDRQSGL